MFGIGSYTYQYQTRDSLGFAMKATSVTINGVEKAIFKDPITDDGTKKSAKGRVVVAKNPRKKDSIVVIDETDMSNYNDILSGGHNLLQTIFENGKIVKETTLAEIRGRLND